MIYVIPTPLTDKEDFDVKKKTRGFELINAPSFWYLHGVLQDEFDFDGAFMFVDYGTSKTESVQTIDGRLYLAPGIYNDVVVEGYDNPCRAYMWHRVIEDKDGNKFTDLRGVVIDPSVKDDLEYAEKLFNEKPFTF